MISCSTTAFKHLSLAAACERIAQLGFQSIDLLLREGWGHVMPSELLRDSKKCIDHIQQLLVRHDLEVSGVNAALTQELSRCGCPLRAQERQEIEAICQLTAACGGPVLTLATGKVDQELGQAASINQAAQVLAEVISIAQGYDLKVAIEIHAGRLVETVAQFQELASGLPELGVTIDPSHFACLQQPLSTISSIMDRIYHVHLRNGRPGSFNADMDEGIVDFAELKRILAQGHYDAYVAIESLSSVEQDKSDEVIQLRDLWCE